MRWLLVVLATLTLTACEEVKSKDKVIDIHQPGYYDSGLCVRKNDWLITIQRPDGTKGDRCVPPSVGQKQIIGTNYLP